MSKVTSAGQVSGLGHTKGCDLGCREVGERINVYRNLSLKTLKL